MQQSKWEKNLKKDRYTESLCGTVPETIATLSINYIPI